MTAPVLLAIDFSPCSHLVTREAGSLARALGADVVILHVAELPEGVTPDTPVPPAEGAPPVPAAALLTADAEARFPIYAHALERLGVASSPRLAWGEAADTILAVAREVSPRLIVMGTHGRTGLPLALMGSIAEHVVARADAPVVTLRTHWRSDCDDATCGLCEADLSPAQRRVLDAARGLDVIKLSYADPADDG
ncbi:MAG: universal stress protein [Alphaproteobacteria bacterium]|nr:universal stress protein [Alphaproteobacteria bacterium]